MNILKELYYGNVNECSSPRKPKTNPKIDKEFIIYEKLLEQLTEEQKQLFEEFIALCDDRQCKDLEDKYIQGFKTGLLIAIESSKLEL